MQEALAYGEQEGRTVHVDEVVSGLACACKCLNCSGRLIARKGPIRAAHFAHQAGTECQGLAEGVLHKVAKEILRPGNVLWIPAYRWSRTARLAASGGLTRSEELAAGGPAPILQAQPEFRGPPGFIPDVCLHVGKPGREKLLFVEIVVSHRVGYRKRRLIRKHGTPTIEIRLDPADLGLPWAALREKVLGKFNGKRWVFHPEEVKHELAFVKALRELRRLERLQRSQTSRMISASGFRTPHTPARRSTSKMAELRRQEAIVETFWRKHRRYPSLEESQAIFGWRLKA